MQLVWGIFEVVGELLPHVLMEDDEDTEVHISAIASSIATRDPNHLRLPPRAEYIPF